MVRRWSLEWTAATKWGGRVPGVSLSVHVRNAVIQSFFPHSHCPSSLTSTSDGLGFATRPPGFLRGWSVPVPRLILARGRPEDARYALYRTDNRFFPLRFWLYYKTHVFLLSRTPKTKAPSRRPRCVRVGSSTTFSFTHGQFRLKSKWKGTFKAFLHLAQKL